MLVVTPNFGGWSGLRLSNEKIMQLNSEMPLLTSEKVGKAGRAFPTFI